MKKINKLLFILGALLVILNFSFCLIIFYGGNNQEFWENCRKTSLSIYTFVLLAYVATKGMGKRK